MTDILHVFFEERHVGCIKRTQGNWSFEYDDVWLNSADGFAVSISLPLRKEPFLDEAARSFFANLLPEAGIREQMARSIGVSLHNDFELLKAFGGECAGALSVIDSSVPERDRGEYTLIDEDALALKIRESGVHPLLLQDGVRLSLAGAQQKIPVFFDQGRFYLP
jgi:serine/threonine-protein kinase HipA